MGGALRTFFPAPRAAAPGCRKCWNPTSLSAAGAESPGPCTSSPHRTGEGLPLGPCPYLVVSAALRRGTSGTGSEGLARAAPDPPPLAPRFRGSCQKIIAHKMFDHVVLVFIFLNCITIALERPDIDPSSTVRRPPPWEGWVPWPRRTPPTVLSLAGAPVPQRLQLHLHGDLRGRNDGEGTAGRGRGQPRGRCSGLVALPPVHHANPSSAPPGGGPGSGLGRARLPAEQLERAGRAARPGVPDRHCRRLGLGRRRQDPGYPAGAAPAADSSAPEVGGAWMGRSRGMGLEPEGGAGPGERWGRGQGQRPVGGGVCAALAPRSGGCPLGPAQHRSSLCHLSRVISRAPGLKLVVETLISSLRPIGNIVLICCAFFIIFGILGVQVRGPLVSGCPAIGQWPVVSSLAVLGGPRPKQAGSCSTQLVSTQLLGAAPCGQVQRVGV